MTDSQDWSPADYGQYGPLFVRMAWRYRFAPLFAAIWIVLFRNIALSLSEPAHGLLARPFSEK